jgi:tetratricopeptide (TPR) repeat protein
MKKNTLFFSIAFLALMAWGTFTRSQDGNPALRKAIQLYSFPNPTEQQDLEAMELFEEVLSFAPDPEESREFVSATEYLGNLHLTYGQPGEAARSYRQGIVWARAYRQPDTLVYNHHLFLGEALFALSQLDSSLIHLQEAERLQQQLKGRGEPERLYNALGVYFFETGNYIRSVSYFDKAQSYLTSGDAEQELYARYSFQSNKASALYHLGEYDSAQRIYAQLLDFDINQDQIRINLANTFLQEGLHEEAIKELDQISPQYQAQSLSFFNLKTKAYLMSGDLDSAKKQLDESEAIIRQDSSGLKSFQKGVWMEVRGDFYRKSNQHQLAIESYHQAILELLPGFKEKSIHSNPTEFSLGMSSLTLFVLLQKKAETAWEIHRKQGETRYFDLGLEAWKSAYGLARFISVNFDNDEARIFLSEKALIAFESGIEQLMNFATQSGRQDLVLEAFAWAEQSKAGGLRIGAQQEMLKRQARLPKDLIQQERNLLFAIFRNNQKYYSDPSVQTKEILAKETLDLEVQLSRLREKFKSYPGFSDELQDGFDPLAFQELIPEHSFVLSLFMGQSNLFLFGMDKEGFSWEKVPLDSIPFDQLNRWMADLVKIPTGKRYEMDASIGKFGMLITSPFEQELKRAEELILIPQGVLNSVPFELLPDASGKPLYERLPVIYQFSAQFIEPVGKAEPLENGIGFAPFSAPGTLKNFASLPYSSEELEAVSGEKLWGKSAIKSAFFAKSAKAEFIHLSTHAEASSTDPNQAFIAFYPDSADFRLFAPELAFQSLEKAKLVFLSACETGAGQLSRSEGLISLARSLAFAGAEQMVITQWVSEDRVAAYLSGQFYRHVADGQTFASALFQAKLDLLADESMAQYHHPFFWANFRLIGQPNETPFMPDWLIWAGFLIGLMILGLWLSLRARVQRM